MAAKERINETVSDVMDKIDDLFWTIREYYSKDMTPDQFAQEVFAQFQTKLDKLKDDLNDELYDDEEVEYTPCDDCYHPHACAWCEYYKNIMERNNAYGRIQLQKRIPSCNSDQP